MLDNKSRQRKRAKINSTEMWRSTVTNTVTGLLSSCSAGCSVRCWVLYTSVKCVFTYIWSLKIPVFWSLHHEICWHKLHTHTQCTFSYLTKWFYITWYFISKLTVSYLPHVTTMCLSAFVSYTDSVAIVVNIWFFSPNFVFIFTWRIEGTD